MLVALLEKDPLIRLPAAAHENPLAFELFPFQDEMKLAFLPSFLRRFGIDHFVGSVIPDDDFARAVIALRDRSLEGAVIDRMIFGLHGEAFVGRIEAGAFRNRP